MLIDEIRTNQLELWRKVKLSGLISSQIALTKPLMGQNRVKVGLLDPGVVLQISSCKIVVIDLIKTN